MRKLARLLSLHYDRALAPVGINVNQYSILRRGSRVTQPMGDLARELGMDRTTLSRDLKPLLAAGWIDLVSGEDARQRCVSVTASGKRLIARAEPLWRRAQDGIESGLGRSRMGSLHVELDRIIDRLQEQDLP
jgi:DNA-binding MarR family transcriptional regulator